MSRSKLAVAVLATLVAFAVLNGCGNKKHRYVACAQTKSGGSSPAPRPPAPAPKPPSAPASPPKAQNSPPPKPATPPSQQNRTAAPPSAQHSEALKNQAQPPPGQNVKAKVTPPGEKAYTPPRADVRPPAKKYDTAARYAPQQVSRGGQYRSPVTNHTYIYRDPIYYSSPGYRLDLFDPYNPWNYTNPYSPFFGRQYVVVDAC
jgi:hypothetical protein